MKKKIVKLIILVVLLSIISVFPKAEDKAEKGDLRCPINNGNKCKEYKENGKVVRVEITETVDELSITKIVKKTEKIGQYTVQFNVKGKTQSKLKANIFLVLDASYTMGDKYYNNVVPATRNFSKYNYGGDVQFGFVTFYRNGVFDSRPLSKETFLDYGFKDNCRSKRVDGECQNRDYATGSPINEGLYYAYNIFKNNNIKNANNFLVILGDGNYKDTYMNGERGALNIIKDIKNIGVNIYAIDYHEKTIQKYINIMKNFTYDAKTKISDENYYVRIKGNNLEHYKEAFQEIAKKISRKPLATSVILNDVVGSDFSVLGENATSFYDKDSKIYDGWYTEEFTISIRNDASNGWHITNGKDDKVGYTLEYKYGDQDKIFKSKINPEVYWEKEKGWEACSDSASSSVESSYIGDFIEKICTQSDGDGIKGFYASLTTRGEQINTKKINLEYGEGFPVEINIQSRVQCVYKFDAEAFTNAYNTKQQEIDNAKNDKEKATKTKELEKIIKEVKSYIDGLDKNNNLDSYQKKFENMTAILQINYKKSGSVEKEFENSKINYNDIECTGDQQSDISFDGKTSKIYTNRTCTLKSSKTLVLSKTCLSMVNGYVEECSSSSKTQLDGGHKFYPSTDKTGGYISVSLKEATFAGLDINLSGKSKSDSKNPNCEFSIGKYNPVIYRQIELSDPFISSNKKRKTGQNWINNKYNFSKIIKEEIWDNDKNYEYQYYISKTDIETIKKDTNEDVNNYLGQNCAFSSNKWICSFVRPTKGKKGSSNYFTEIRIN